MEFGMLALGPNPDTGREEWALGALEQESTGPQPVLNERGEVLVSDDYNVLAEVALLMTIGESLGYSVEQTLAEIRKDLQR